MISADGLNQAAHRVFVALAERAAELNVQPTILECGAHVLDCGVHVTGGLQAGVELARICMADRSCVEVVSGGQGGYSGPCVQVVSDRPIEACMFGQYAGWPVKHGSFFAMGSGPMRIRRGKEPILEALAANDSQALATGSLECDVMPDCDVATQIAAECEVPPHALHLAIAPTRSLAGCVQVVARSLETALHKMHELGGDLLSVRSGYGVAPLPPPTPDFALGIGRTNDAILYGGRVTLWMEGDDDQLVELGKQLPSKASKDYGLPFAETFKTYDYDFYKVDPNLFSPAEVTLVNLSTGRSWTFGETRSDLLEQSFATVKA